MSVINCCGFLSRSGSSWFPGGFQTLDFSMPFVFPIALIYFLISFSIQIIYFSLKVSSSSSSWFVCHHRMQDSECRSNGYNRYDTFPAFNTWRMNAKGHSRKTCEATVPILMLTSDRVILVVGMSLKFKIWGKNVPVSVVSYI